MISGNLQDSSVGETESIRGILDPILYQKHPSKLLFPFLGDSEIHCVEFFWCKFPMQISIKHQKKCKKTHTKQQKWMG